MPVWTSSAKCTDKKCEFEIPQNSDLELVADKAKEHRYETGHVVKVEDARH
jgi:hypothetical protein